MVIAKTDGKADASTLLMNVAESTTVPEATARPRYTTARHDGWTQSPTNLTDLLQRPPDGAALWLDLVNPTPQHLAELQQALDLHPLAVEDALKAHQRPKIESFGSSWFLVVHAASRAEGVLGLHEIALFVTPRVLVTVRYGPAYPLDEIERRWRSGTTPLGQGSGALLYAILA